MPPDTFGNAALWLKAADAQSHYAFGLMFKEMGDQNGTWRVRHVGQEEVGNTEADDADRRHEDGRAAGEEWRRHDLKIPIDAPQRNSSLGARLIASGGDVLVDDIEIWKEEDSRNPTVFRDLVVDPLRKLNPGILRYLQMGGSDLETNLRPALQQMGWTRDWRNLLSDGRNRASHYRFNLHEFYVLCEYIGADPWYCLPGTIHPQEFQILMEYLAAPADVGYGKVRAELGHPKPWTEVFRNIYVEVGNEAWNSAGYATGSYNGPDHWKDLFAAGKASPHYRATSCSWPAPRQVIPASRSPCSAMSPTAIVLASRRISSINCPGPRRLHWTPTISSSAGSSVSRPAAFYMKRDTSAGTRRSRERTALSCRSTSTTTTSPVRR